MKLSRFSKECLFFIGCVLVGASLGIAAAKFTARLVNLDQPSFRRKWSLDNHSFAAGIWIAQVAHREGVSFTANKHDQGDGWYSPTGFNHSEILWWCRHHALTNGWGDFNNREGFRGDEGVKR